MSTLEDDSQNGTMPTPKTKTTRVCIKNLPKNFTDEKLRRHLSSSTSSKKKIVFIITDLKTLKTKKGVDRRMAFVGFQTPEMAELCVETFDKTYLKTSRLSVQPAFASSKTSNNNDHRAWSQHTPGSSAYERRRGADPTNAENDNDDNAAEKQLLLAAEKEKHKIQEDKILIDRKKEEFVNVMMGKQSQMTTNDNNDANAGNNNQSRMKLWSNDDIVPHHPTREENHKEEDDGNDADTDDSSTASNDEDDDDDDNSMDSNDSADALRGHRTDTSATAPISASVMSDMDFFKSKIVPKTDILSDDDANNKSNKDATKLSSNCNDSDGNSSSSVPSSTTSGDSDSDSDTSSSSSDEENDVGSKSIALTSTSQSSKPPEKDEAQSNSDNIKKYENSNRSSSDTPLTNRLFLRNLPFTTTEEDLRSHFENDGATKLKEVHIPMDDYQKSKGFAFLEFSSVELAKLAMEEFDGMDFQGRLLHILPGKANPHAAPKLTSNDGDDNDGGLTYKQRKELERKQKANEETGWSSSFLRSDAVMDTLAQRLGDGDSSKRKSELLNVTSEKGGDFAAVKVALGETHILEENRTFCLEHGIQLEGSSSKHNKNNTTSSTAAVKKLKRSNMKILVKNLPYGSDTQKELRLLFTNAISSQNTTDNDDVMQVHLPVSKTMALIEFSHANFAKKAFQRLAYKRFKHVPLYLEWAPLATGTDVNNKDINDNIKKSEVNSIVTNQNPTKNNNSASTSQMASSNAKGAAQDDNDLDDPTDTTYKDPDVAHSVFIKNLSFSTTESQLKSIFETTMKKLSSTEDYARCVRAVKIPTKTRALSSSQNNNTPTTLSMGYGFVELSTAHTAKAAMAALQGKIVDGHAWEIKPSTKDLASTSSSTSRKLKNSKSASGKKLSSKVMVRNVPFSATRTELYKLFSAHGKIQNIRLPKKFDGTHRGFAFCKFVSGQEAANAMEKLGDTHLYGRRLVLEVAEEDDTGGIDGLREKAKRDIGSKNASGVVRQNKKIKFDEYE
eukprot:CAMPEP_0194399882 /NCGR_PEP_ID=MMETSP0174-20130528/126906_1 /TAXON_ID=216777 /ORGANISM="Proboscia alata, Strain PI-D3" /LENGTH=1011 /DNA_ID=CAMNT_0039196339 /DNA_START=179 /DNA_END=3215 /DNA_ORIENTATION=-